MSDDLKAGDKFADYVIVRTIGVGGMGRVYEAEHVFTGRRVALKITYRHRAENPELRARAVQEARATAELRHKNIITLESANITAGGVVWIATEYLDGHTLREKLALSRRLGVEEALGYLIELCDGIAAAHDIGIVHRDLKPENVFVTSQNAVKVLDFGAARAPGLGLVSTTAELVQRGGARRVIGTPAYMAPEQARGERAGPAADIYSIGVMGYELLGSRHPFADPDGGFPDPLELNRRHIEQAPVPLSHVAPDVPDFVCNVLCRAMEKDPARRQPSAVALAGELRAARARQRDAQGEAPRKPFTKEWIEPGSWAAHGPAFDVPARDEAPSPARERMIVPAAPPASTAAVQARAQSVAMGPRAAPNPGAPRAPGLTQLALTTVPLTAAAAQRAVARRRWTAARAAAIFVGAVVVAGALAIAAIVMRS